MKSVSSKRMIQILFRKEMKDIFRDRKSVLMMFFVPVVLYPLIFVVAFFIVSMMQTGVGVQTYHVVLDGVEDTRLEEQLKELRREDNRDKATYEIMFFNTDDFAAITEARAAAGAGQESTDDASEAGRVAEADSAAGNAGRGSVGTADGADGMARQQIAAALQEGSIDVYVRFEGGRYTSYYNSSVTNSAYAESLIETAISDVKYDLIVENLEANGLDAEQVLNPVSLEKTDTATSEQSLGYFLGTIIPFMMIISLLVGVFTPAIDATTGEKERGTLETLLMMPVTNSQIIVSKFLSVALVGLITTLLSIASMAGLGAYMLNLVAASGQVDLGGINVGTFLPAIAIALPVLIVLSLFLTAISMCVTCFAKTYKEANTYMSPVMIVVMLTGYIGFIPNIDFDRSVAMIPVANVCLLIKNLLLFKVDLELVLIVIASTAVYTGLVILLLGKMYKSEAILFDEGRHGLALLERRSNMKKGGVPSSGDGWFVVMVGFLLLVYVGGLLQTHYGLNGVAMSQVVLVALPLAMAAYSKKSLGKTFSFRAPCVQPQQAPADGVAQHPAAAPDGTGQAAASRPTGRLRAWGGGLLLGIGMIGIGMVFASLMIQLFPEEGTSVSTQLTDLFNGPALWVWVVVSVCPAICEEMLFRGYVLSAFRERYPMWVSIIGVGVFFGIYHTSLVRFPTTALFGATLAYIVCRTGSIFPGMVVHWLNNSIAVISMFFPEFIRTYLPFLADDVLSLSDMLIVGGFGLVMASVGVLLLRKRGQ
ncbi:MAG: ABC transporter permease subunit/CPBP intramembrane protease [Eubacterium sp.]|nr:ABC transporter permease subunit/CPBP intramembrane protease [Eubacterium sp.]